MAFKDELGIEPPIIKVQVKYVEGAIGAPAVQALYGNVENGEYGLLITLGDFTKQAEDFAKTKTNLNLFKYSKYYSGQEPEFIEGDVFRIIVPLVEEYSYDSLNEKVNGSNGQDKSDQLDHSDQSNQIEENLEERLIKLLAEKPDIKTKEITESLGWSSSQVKYYMKKLKDDNKVTRHGTNRNGYWEIL